MAEVQPPVSLEQRVRSAQRGTSARLMQVAGSGTPSDPNAALREELAAIRKLVRCQAQLLEQNFGALEDEQVWLPFAFNIPAGAQVIVTAKVDQDTVFYYRGYGATEVPGVSFIEVIDGLQGPEHFRPPSAPNDTSGTQYGNKGKRVYGRVDIVISNANAAIVTMDGFIFGRFRKGGR